jgi:hypothetical protein
VEQLFTITTDPIARVICSYLWRRELVGNHFHNHDHAHATYIYLGRSYKYVYTFCGLHWPHMQMGWAALTTLDELTSHSMIAQLALVTRVDDRVCKAGSGSA